MSDYLWDPSAEADLEVEEFEDALSAMRYRVGTPVVPARLEQALRLRRPRVFPRLLAAAAAVALVFLASGLWLSWQAGRRLTPTSQQSRAVVENLGSMGVGANDEASPLDNKTRSLTAQAELGKKDRNAWRRMPARKRVGALAVRKDGGRAPAINAPAAVDRGRDQYASKAASGEAAKAQIMLALQITSSKLNMAQRMAQRNVAP